MEMYAIRDEKMGLYMTPFFSPNLITAMRNLTGALRQKDSMLAQFPGDFSLYKLADFDKETGLFQANEPKFMATISSLAQQEVPSGKVP